MLRLINFLASAGGPPGSSGPGGTINPDGTIGGSGSLFAMGFDYFLQLLLNIYDHLQRMGFTLMRWLGADYSFPVFDFENFTFTMQSFSLFEVVFGAAFGVFIGGMLWKWLKEFIA